MHVSYLVNAPKARALHSGCKCLKKMADDVEQVCNFHNEILNRVCSSLYLALCKFRIDRVCWIRVQIYIRVEFRHFKPGTFYKRDLDDGFFSPTCFAANPAY